MAQNSEKASLPDSAFSQVPAFPLKPGAELQHVAPGEPSAAMPPGMASVKQHTADEVLDMMNRVPLFMTTLDDTDGEGGSNVELEALKALAYEGTRAEVAANFREQGNDAANTKSWTDAKEFYDKALAALKGPRNPSGDPEVEALVVDLDEEEAKEKKIEEACYVNRALCNLEKKNYRSCIQDCASTLRLNPSNIKALYRSASACLALDKLPEALDACQYGLAIDSSNASLTTLLTKINSRKSYLDTVVREREARESRARTEAATLAHALKARNIRVRRTSQEPDLHDAEIRLENPVDASSTLKFPVVLLYPLAAQSDFVKEFAESDSVGEHLAYILPVPWDEEGAYTSAGVDCYVETLTGGLVKVGKKAPLLKVLAGGKVEIVDGLLKMYIVPTAQVGGWIEQWKARRVN